MRRKKKKRAYLVHPPCNVSVGVGDVSWGLGTCQWRRGHAVGESNSQ